MPLRLPADDNRHAIIGRTGSGKTVAALWHLSIRNFDQMPWLIYNFKYDANIDAIPHAEHIGVDEVPTGNGVYIVHPMPNETAEVEAQMWEVWKRGNTGIYVDEGYMVAKNNQAFRALLTQGRSKRIPMIILSQRPVWMDTFVFSEAEFFQVFHLNYRKDIKRVEEYVPAQLGERLPEYYSYYYDVGRNELSKLKPTPPVQKIMEQFDRRLKNRKHLV